MKRMDVTQSEFEDILSVFQERGVEILHSVQDGEVKIYSHFDEVESILWAARVADGLKYQFQGAEVGCYVAGVQGQYGHD